MAAALTLLQIVNKTLRRVRERQVVDLADEYSLLLVDFVNETQDEIQRDMNWDRSRDTYQVTTVPGTFTYTLTGLGDGFVITDVINDTQNYVMHMMESKALNRLFTLTDTPTTGQPIYWGMNGYDALTGDPIIDFFPVPVAADDVMVYTSDPSGPLTLVGDEPVVPSHLLFLGTVAKAIADRGDASDSEIARAEAAYTQALSDYVDRELDRLGEGDLRAV